MILQPKKHILLFAKDLKRRIGTRNWLSIQSKGFYDPTGEKTRKAFTVAMTLLEAGEVAHVFFATESARLEDIARDVLGDKYKSSLLIYKSEEINRNETDNSGMFSNNLRDKDETEKAILDWYLIGRHRSFYPNYICSILQHKLFHMLGEATYCMCPTIQDSTFAKTSILRGDCKFIPLKNETFDYVSNVQKIALFGTMKNPIIDQSQYGENIEIESDEELHKLWNKAVVVSTESFQEQCFDMSRFDYVQDFWESYMNVVYQQNGFTHIKSTRKGSSMADHHY